MDNNEKKTMTLLELQKYLDSKMKLSILLDTKKSNYFYG